MDVRNHLATERLLVYLGRDIFIFHGYAEFYVEGRWVTAARRAGEADLPGCV